MDRHSEWEAASEPLIIHVVGETDDEQLTAAKEKAGCGGILSARCIRLGSHEYAALTNEAEVVAAFEIGKLPSLSEPYFYPGETQKYFPAGSWITATELASYDMDALRQHLDRRNARPYKFFRD